MPAAHFRKIILNEDSLRELLNEPSCDWRNLLFYKINFGPLTIDWPEVQCHGAAFIACQFDWDTPLPLLMGQGAFILNKLPSEPYDPYPLGLYTPEQLMSPRNGNYEDYPDADIYRHYKTTREQTSLLQFFTRWIHDYSIQVSLDSFLKGRRNRHEKKVVGIMGGHSRWRTNPEFRQVALIARQLARKGYCIATGGGPGAMEAANLGAWLSPYPDSALDEALALLSAAPQYTSSGYLETAWKVKHLYPEGAESLSVPTWFYGHEPTNIFASHIAKYFSNSIREDGLLSICNYGVIYTPGRAGTVQEIFMDATQNHYGTFKYISPMIFFGKEFFDAESGIMHVLRWLSQGLQYADMLTITDDVDKVVSAVENYVLTPYEKEEN